MRRYHSSKSAWTGEIIQRYVQEIAILERIIRGMWFVLLFSLKLRANQVDLDN